MRYPTMLLTFLLAGCASTANNRGQIAIATTDAGQPLPGAHCSVTHNTQTWDIVTPATLTVGRADGDLSVRCDHDGYRSSELRIPPAASNRTGPGVSLGLGGLTGGGASIFGTGVGLSLPFGGNNGSNGSYPAEVTVQMTREAASESPENRHHEIDSGLPVGEEAP